MTDSTTCAIVGGGPAGMVLGLLLARAGVEVTVLEKHADFLRDFRGDTVHPSTLRLLDDLGLWPQFAKIPQSKVDHAAFGVDGKARQNFTIAVRRVPGLSDIDTSVGTLVPDFAPDVYDYDLAISAPSMAWGPSSSWLTALPISCKSAPRLASFTSSFNSEAMMPQM